MDPSTLLTLEGGLLEGFSHRFAFGGLSANQLMGDATIRLDPYLEKVARAHGLPELQDVYIHQQMSAIQDNPEDYCNSSITKDSFGAEFRKYSILEPRARPLSKREKHISLNFGLVD